MDLAYSLTMNFTSGKKNEGMAMIFKKLFSHSERYVAVASRAYQEAENGHIHLSSSLKFRETNSNLFHKFFRYS